MPAAARSGKYESLHHFSLSTLTHPDCWVVGPYRYQVRVFWRWSMVGHSSPEPPTAHPIDSFGESFCA